MSSTPETDHRVTHHEYRRDEVRKSHRDRRRMLIKRVVEDAYQYRGSDTESFAEVVGVLARELDIHQRNCRHYSWNAKGLDLPFDDGRIASWLETFDKMDDALAAAGAVGPSDLADEVLRSVFHSLETAAAIEGYLPAELEGMQPTYGLATQLGERYVRAESAATGDLQIRDTDDELKSILCAGGKGSGKSTAVETLAMDSYAHGHKIVDLVDFFKSENAAYDIPQKDNGKGLIEAREQMDLPVGFDDLEAGMAWLDGDVDDDLVTSPELEVLCPLSPGLAEMDVPTIPQVDEQVVRPFTIPASKLTFRQLVMLLHHSTKTQENHLRSAHQRLRDKRTDWTLADLAETVRNETNAGDNVADRIETSLQTAQSKSFIRDTECPHALDWGEIMRDQETITAFTVHPIKETSDHLVVLSYLIDSLFEARKELIKQHLLSSFPPLTVVMREMHEVAPRMKSEQDSESTIEGFMIDTLGDMFALTRHADMEILADTQKFHRQLSPDVSGLFDHILAFQGQAPDVKKIFKTRIDNTKPAQKVAQFQEPGRCAFVSEDGYRMPIQLAPPRNHHLEAQLDGNGLGFRSRSEETPERLLESPWDAEVPDRLSFGNVARSDPERFMIQWMTDTGDEEQWELKDEITEAYNHWADVNERRGMAHNQLHQAVVNYFGISDLPDKRKMIDGKEKRAHKRIKLTYDGHKDD